MWTRIACSQIHTGWALDVSAGSAGVDGRIRLGEVVVISLLLILHGGPSLPSDPEMAIGAGTVSGISLLPLQQQKRHQAGRADMPVTA